MYTPKPFNESYLPEVDGHKVYYAEYGNPDGEVVVHLHGGPGSQGKPKHAARFDLEKYRVILPDQRGCGKSEPRGRLEHNTTQDLVADLERLREQLGLEQWVIAGSSWGSTLALVYAETHPDRLKGLMVSAVFLADETSFEWFVKKPTGAASVYADLWDKRNADLAALGINSPDCAQELYELILNGSADKRSQALAICANWEANLLSSLYPVKYVTPEEVSEEAALEALIFLHYETNDAFLTPDQIINNAANIKDIPTMITHGRHDMICPYEQAWRLHQALPNSELVTLPQSNHQYSPDGQVAVNLAFLKLLERVTKD